MLEDWGKSGWKRIIWALFFATLISSLGVPNVRAQSLKEFYISVIPLEIAKPIQYQFNISFQDLRDHQRNLISLKLLESKVNEVVETRANRREQELVGSQSVLETMLTILISYFGYYRTSGGTWCGKSQVELKFLRASSGNIIVRPASIDLTFSTGALTGERRLRWDSLVVEKTTSRIIQLIDDYTAESPSPYWRVIAGGSTAILADSATTMAAALLSAKEAACRKVAGEVLSSQTINVDFGATVTDTVRSQMNATVLDYEIIDQLTRRTIDGYLCVVIDAIVRGGNEIRE